MQVNVIIYSLIKEEVVFTKIVKFLVRVSNIIRNKFKNELIYIQYKYLKVLRKRRKKTPKRKNENYYRKVSLEKYYFIEDIEIFFSNSDEKYYDEESIKCMNMYKILLKFKNVLNLTLESFIS